MADNHNHNSKGSPYKLLNELDWRILPYEVLYCDQQAFGRSTERSRTYFSTERKNLSVLDSKAFIKRELHKHKLVLFVWNRKVTENKERARENIKGVYNQEKLYY